MEPPYPTVPTGITCALIITAVSVVSSIDGCELSSSVYNVTKVVTKFIVPYKSYCLVCPTFKNASGLKWNYGTDNTLLYRDDIQRSTHHSLSLNINDPECSDTKYSLELSASHVGTAEGFYTCWERDQAIAAFCLRLVERPKLTIIRNGAKISHGFEATGETQEEMKCRVQSILTPFSLIWFVNGEVYQNENIESGLHSELKNFTSNVHITISASTEDITCMVNDTMFHTHSVSVKVSYIEMAEELPVNNLDDLIDMLKDLLSFIVAFIIFGVCMLLCGRFCREQTPNSRIQRAYNRFSTRTLPRRPQEISINLDYESPIPIGPTNVASDGENSHTQSYDSFTSDEYAPMDIINTNDYNCTDMVEYEESIYTIQIENQTDQ
ncbi:uncharacterized protein [Apostichopus japonicus]|uniref:uncharacterized protein isoform X1 n=1 Tax=Stichopus japonicus TaxID=307972 RepID=UPI003AB79C0C